MSWAPPAKAPGQKVKRNTRRRLHELQRSTKQEARVDRKAERAVEKRLAREDAKEAAARKGCAT